MVKSMWATARSVAVVVVVVVEQPAQWQLVRAG